MYITSVSGAITNYTAGKSVTKNQKEVPDFVSNLMTTSEELFEYQKQQAEKKGSTRPDWAEQWNKEHPNLAGVKCICDSDGQWYTAEEISKVWNEQLKSDGTVFI